MSIDYVARVTLDTREDVDDRLRSDLERYQPLVGRSVLGNAEVTIVVPGADIVQVLQTTVAVLARTLDAPVLGVEIMSHDEYLRRDRAGALALPGLLSVTEASRQLGVTRQAVLQRLAAGTLAGQMVGSTWVVPAASVARELGARELSSVQAAERERVIPQR